MSEKDKLLVIKAECCFDWTIASDFEQEAESAQAKAMIHDIVRRLHQREEFEADCY